MSHLPVLSGRELISALERVGYIIVRQRGSHIRLRHPTDPLRRPITVPDHRSLKTGTMRAILRDAGVSPEQLRDLL